MLRRRRLLRNTSDGSRGAVGRRHARMPTQAVAEGRLLGLVHGCPVVCFAEGVPTRRLRLLEERRLAARRDAVADIPGWKRPRHLRRSTDGAAADVDVLRLAG